MAKPQERDFQGLDIHIEWPKGSTRTGVNDEGEPWERDMVADYGYIEDTPTSGDGEDLDVYIGPDDSAPIAWVIEQLDQDGNPDEIKVMLGFGSEPEAVACYRKHYPPEWDSVGDVWPIKVVRLCELVAKSQGKSKKASFLTEDEVREVGRQAQRAPAFQEALRRIAPGQRSENLDQATFLKVWRLSEELKPNFPPYKLKNVPELLLPPGF